MLANWILSKLNQRVEAIVFTSYMGEDLVGGLPKAGKG
jgi:hypothetical protein